MAINPEFLRGIDWARTPIGPMDAWPQSLKAMVAMILGLPTPAIVFWGPKQTQIYNEGYAVIMGPRHPRYYGATYEESWPETYPILIPLMRRVLDEGQTLEVLREPITLTRHGFAEEAFFTFTFSPLYDDEGKIAGVYQPVVEMTDSVLRERRAETVRLLGACKDVLPQAVAIFDASAADIPFAGIYSWNEQEGRLRVTACSGFADANTCESVLSTASDAIAKAFSTNSSLEMKLEAPLPARPWPEPVHTLFLTPIRRAERDEPEGVVVFAVSPRLHFDRQYRDFFETIARELGTNLAARRAEQAQNDWLAREQAARRESEATKEAHARRVAALFEHAPVGIAVLQGPEHVFEVANPQYASLLPKHALLHRPIRAALPELEGQGIFELLDRVFETAEPFVGRSVRLMVDRGDGEPEERFFDFAYQAMPGSDGKTDSILVVAFEVTELSKARRDAEAASRAKDEFFAVLGHELRNPLAPITTALQLMRLRGDETLAKERTIIERQVGQITRLVDDLLDVSRITRGKVTLKREAIELSEIVAKAIEMASPLLDERHHHLTLDVPSRGLIVDGDPVRLAQVMSNLLANAAKYTPAGGRIGVSARRRGAWVVVHVTDTGVGITPEMLPRVFDAFAQAQQTIDRAQGGLGLGLTIVENLVKLHGGAVKAESAGAGRGSTFTVELPLSEVRASTSLAAPIGEKPRRQQDTFRVLVVDDNVDAAEILAETLGVLGYQTRVAYDGAEAITAAAEFDPDVALLDIGLPVMDGYELASRLRSGPRGGELRLVAVTGYGQDSDRRRAAAAGFDAHLVKPVQVDVVADMIDKYRAAAAAARLTPTSIAAVEPAT